MYKTTQYRTVPNALHGCLFNNLCRSVLKQAILHTMAIKSNMQIITCQNNGHSVIGMSKNDLQASSVSAKSTMVLSLSLLAFLMNLFIMYNICGS